MLRHITSNGQVQQMSNKTVNQVIRYHVSQNNWLGPSTTTHLFRHDEHCERLHRFLWFSAHDWSISQSDPPLVSLPPPSAANLEIDDSVSEVVTILKRLEDNVQAAKDNLLLAKVTQVAQRNKNCLQEKPYVVGDKVMLSTFHHRCEYVQKGQNWWPNLCLDLMDHTLLQMRSNTLCLHHSYANSPDLYSTFHALLLKPFIPNDLTCSLHECNLILGL